MAQQSVTKLVDDITGDDAHRTHRLTVDGTTVEIDLADDTWAPIAHALAPVFTYGRLQSQGAAARRTENAAQRTWARREGYAVSDKGRLPQSVIAAWRAAGAPGGVASSRPLH